MNLPAFSRRRCLPLFGVVLFCLAAGGPPAPLRAETTEYSGATQITALPVTLSTPGTYYLAQDFTVNLASGAAITVSAAGVTIDLNSHTLTNTAESANTATGITANQTNVTVRDGTITGFSTGVSANSAYGDLLENLNLVKNWQYAATVWANARIVRCRAILTGGNSSNFPCISFYLENDGNTLEDCDVYGKSGAASAYGVSFGDSADNFVVNNRFSGIDYAIGGFGCKYRDNLTSSVATPYSGSTDAGNNN